MKRCAVTLLELVVTVAIVAILVGLLLVTLRPAKDRANLATCTNNLQQLFISHSLYVEANDGWAPLGSLDGMSGGTLFEYDLRPETFKKALMTYGATEDLFWCPSLPVPRGQTVAADPPLSMTYSSYADPFGWLRVAHPNEAHTIRYRPADLAEPSQVALFAENVWGTRSDQDGVPSMVFHGPHGESLSNQVNFDGHIHLFRVTANKR